MEKAKVNAISKVTTCFSRRIPVVSNSPPKVSKGTKRVLSVVKTLEKGAEAFRVDCRHFQQECFKNKATHCDPCRYPVTQ